MPHYRKRPRALESRVSVRIELGMEPKLLLGFKKAHDVHFKFLEAPLN